MQRQVECEVTVLAMAEMAGRAEALQIGERVKLQGFIARRSLKSQQLELHVNTLETIS